MDRDDNSEELAVPTGPNPDPWVPETEPDKSTEDESDALGLATGVLLWTAVPFTKGYPLGNIGSVTTVRRQAATSSRKLASIC